jgi:3-phosphoshikimate 1-carboxyvinyltransferase
VGPLTEALAALGASTEPAGASRLPMTVTGSGLAGGQVTIPGNQSSQYHSAVLMAAPLARARVEVLTSELVSRPYVDLTCTMMEEFGVRVERDGYTRLAVNAPAMYRARDYVVEADASTASYFFAAAAVTGGRVTVTNISKATSRQGDIRFLDVLEQMGCRVLDEGNGATVVGTGTLRGIELDMKDISDTFMTLACLAPFADGPVTISGIGHTRVQESDRISAVQKGLENLGIRAESGPDFIRVYPGEPRGARISAHGDHRIAMAFSVIGLRTPGVVIEQADAVSKTCPGFFSLWDQIVG